jgi:hypothetical protein
MRREPREQAEDGNLDQPKRAQREQAGAAAGQDGGEQDRFW